jgi:hypothetical protein
VLSSCFSMCTHVVAPLTPAASMCLTLQVLTPPLAAARLSNLCCTGYGGGAGGIAYLGIFGDPRYATAFVFPKNLGPDYPKFIAEAASHGGQRLL